MNLENKVKIMETSSTEKNNSALTITIHSMKRPAEIEEQLPSFEVDVLVQMDNHQAAWTMTLLPGARVPIRFDESQEVILIAHEQLLVDSSGLDKSTPVHLEHEDPEHQERDGQSEP